MADEQDRWLDRETAERLLRGEPLETVDADARPRAEQLARALRALSVESPPTSAELPGEAAALAAFRKARDGHAAERTAAGRGAGDGVPDAGLVRIGGPDRRAPRARWGRPLRLGLAATLAVGMVGGVAVAAGTGVLPTPFGDAEPGPAASVSAGTTSDGPLTSPSPSFPQGLSTGGAPGRGPARSTAPGGTATDDAAGSGRDGGAARGGTASACRAVRDGKSLNVQRRRALESAAGGSARVWTYCKTVLRTDTDTGTGSTEQDGRGQGSGNGDDKGKSEDKGKSDGKGESRDKDKGGDEGEGEGGSGGQGGDDADGNRTAPGGAGGERGRGRGAATGVPSSVTPTLPERTVATPAESPAPTYSAL